MYYDKDKFADKGALIDFLVRNKESIIAQKKAVLKKGLEVAYSLCEYENEKHEVVKANQPVENIGDLSVLRVLVVINTTNLMDGHDDVHFPNLWKKSLMENKMIMHLQEHDMKFDKIISDGKDLKAFAKYFKWTELGYAYEGKTQALVFDSKIHKDRNEYMFKQYAKGYVKNHSVGMRYVKLELAVDDEAYPREFAVWEKYIGKVANAEKAQEQGFFWAVTEAKIIEGSAVPVGSNQATPTLENNKEKEPLQNSTLEQDNEPQKQSTQSKHRDFYLQLLK